MAARRVAKSAVDWAAFAERIPKNQGDAFRAFKAKSENFVQRVHKNPEALPGFDWGFFKARVGNPAMVDAFQKAYQGVTVPYPKDKANMVAAIDADEKAAIARTAEEVKQAQGVIGEAKAMLAKVKSLPPLEDISHEMYTDYFPDQARNPVQNPTIWPHRACDQNEGDPHAIK